MEETELKLKELIINRYGNLKKFADKIDMPWTTLDSILKRGIANSNITNVIKITRELHINTECLASGNIIDATYKDISQEPTEHIYKQTSSISKNSEIIIFYNQLNDFGKREATKRVEELTYFPQYTTRQELNAAHERTDIEIPEDVDTSDDDIMDDENF